MMQPVRIKVYGLIPMTRKTYLIAQVVVLVITLAMMAVGAAAMLRAGTLLPQLPAEDGEKIELIDLLARMLVFLFWAGVLILIGESIETYLVLRRFARADAEQQARLAALDSLESAPSAPTSTAVQSSPNVSPPNTNIQP